MRWCADAFSQVAVIQSGGKGLRRNRRPVCVCACVGWEFQHEIQLFVDKFDCDLRWSLDVKEQQCLSHVVRLDFLYTPRPCCLPFCRVNKLSAACRFWFLCFSGLWFVPRRRYLSPRAVPDCLSAFLVLIIMGCSLLLSHFLCIGLILASGSSLRSQACLRCEDQGEL